MSTIRVGAVYRNGGAFYRMKRAPTRFRAASGWYVWALWRPVRPVLGGMFYIPVRGREDFWVDTAGFELVSRTARTTREPTEPTDSRLSRDVRESAQ